MHVCHHTLRKFPRDVETSICLVLFCSEFSIIFTHYSLFFRIYIIMIINLTIGHSHSFLPVQTYVQQQL